MKTKVLTLFLLATVSLMSMVFINQALASGGSTIGAGGCPGCTETPPPPPPIEDPTEIIIFSLPCSGEPETHYYCPNITGDKESCEEQLLCSQDSCEPEIGNPSCSLLLQSNQFFYCGDLRAINGKSQQKCLEDNNTGTGDTCLRNDGLCMYIRTTNPTPVTLPTPVVTTTSNSVTATTPVVTTTNTPVSTTSTPNPVSTTTPATTPVVTTTTPVVITTNPPVSTTSTPDPVSTTTAATTPVVSTTTPVTTQNNTNSELQNWINSLADDENIAPENSVCGNGNLEIGETCDDGLNNGKNGSCSSDCLYVDETPPVLANDPLSSSSVNNSNASPSNVTESTLALGLRNTSNIISKGIARVMGVFGTSINKIGESLKKGRDDVKNIIIANTSPQTRETIQNIAEVAVVVGKYTVIGATALLGTTTAALNVMVYKAHWSSYTVQPGDTFDSLGSKFTMTERAMRKKNSLSKGELSPGTKIKVRNRNLIEKDYLDQLKFVLKDSLEKRNFGKMSAKIDQLFAKK